MERYDTICAKLVPEGEEQRGRFDIIESGGRFDVFDQESGMYAETGLTKRQAYAEARRRARAVDANIRAERKKPRKGGLDLSGRFSHMFDLSTGHLTEGDRDILTEAHDSIPRAIPHDYGAIVFIAGADDKSILAEALATLRERGHSEAMLRIYRAAAKTDALLINFDADAAFYADIGEPKGEQK